MSTHSLRLGDLGESGIRDRLILPRLPNASGVVVGPGDDAAVIELPLSKKLVMTTDPCPQPVADLVAAADYFNSGWLTILINVSDLAAMAAEPLGIVISLTMPEEMESEDLQRFLDGAVAAANEWDCPIIGGNIKDGREFTATGSAVGAVYPTAITRRSGVAVGDAICAVGLNGVFWAGVAARLLKLEEQLKPFGDAFEEALFRPTAKLKAALRLAEGQFVTAATDASDGLGGALRDLAVASGVNILVTDFHVPEPVQAVSDLSGIDPRNLALAWGDWQLVVALPQCRVDEARERVMSTGHAFSVLGIANPGEGSVLAVDEAGAERPIRLFASDRFSNSSYFTYGLGAYLDSLRASLYVDD